MPNLSIKSQGAVEYLITHAWAILIIVIVIAVLATLGLFSANNQPTIPPGSCQVQRPYGPGTTQQISMVGNCNNGIPKFVALWGNSGGSISGNFISSATWNSGFTIAVWVDYMAVPTGWPDIGGIYSQPGDYAYFDVNSNNGNLDPYVEYWPDGCCSGNGGGAGVTHAVSLNRWYFLTGTWNPNLATSNVRMYVNGAFNSSATITQTVNGPINPEFVIGNSGAGYVANLQIYDTALSPNDIQSLYIDGIGGTPIDIYHLVGWWPLNGNGNDYSGNGDNAQTISTVTWSSSWINTYSAP